MGKLLKILKSNKGASLVMVLMLFAVLSILAMSALYVSASNTRQVASQHEYMQAYYIAYSGIELGYAALFTDTDTLDLLGEFKKGDITSLGPEDISIGDSSNKATVKIEISNTGKTIIITSTGKIKNGKTSKTLQMSFPVNYPELRKWVQK